MARYGLLTQVQLEASDTAGDNPRYGELDSLGLEAVDDTGTTTPRHGELHALTLDAITVAVAPIAPRTVKSMVLVELDAILTDGTHADTYTWSVVSGDAVAITTSGPGGSKASFVTIASVAGSTTVIGVTGTKAGTTSPQVTATITTRPHLLWIKTATGWSPIRMG